MDHDLRTTTDRERPHALVWIDSHEAIVVRWEDDQARIERVTSQVPDHHKSTGHVRHDPAVRHVVDGGPATVGFISSVSTPFCGGCDRVRLTADGQFRNCLFAQVETDLRTPLRAGATDDEVLALMTTSVQAKAAGHGINNPDFLQPPRPMSAIGG